MKCPTCQKSVSDEAAVCPHCDTVLDPSLLDPDPRPRPARKAPSRPSGQPRRKGPARASTAKGGQARPARMPEAPPPARAAQRRDWREEISQADWDEMPQGKAVQFVPDKALDPDDVIGQAFRFLGQLTGPDKLAFFGGLALFLACFFPWKETVQDGEVLGLMSSGVVVFGLSLVALAAIVIRVQRSIEGMNPLMAWVAQLGALGLAELWSLIYLRLAWDATLVRAPIGNYEMWASKPTFGLILALLSGVVAIMGTLLGLRVAPP